MVGVKIRLYHYMCLILPHIDVFNMFGLYSFFLPLHGIAWQCTMQCGKWTIEFFMWALGRTYRLSYVIMLWNEFHSLIPRNVPCHFFCWIMDSWDNQLTCFRRCHDWTFVIMYILFGQSWLEVQHLLSAVIFLFIVCVDRVLKRPRWSLWRWLFPFIFYSHFRALYWARLKLTDIYFACDVRHLWFFMNICLHDWFSRCCVHWRWCALSTS